MILLTDEEIWAIDNKLCDDPLYIEECHGDKALLYSIRQFNKAQLKKVVWWLRGNNHGGEVLMINAEKWQTLLEEVKE